MIQMRIKEEYIIDSLPDFVEARDIDKIFLHAIKHEASDIHFEGKMPIVAEIHGKLYPLTERYLSTKEVENIIKKLYAENALAEINRLNPIDTNYTIKLQNPTPSRHRFRVNATGTVIGNQNGIQITVRTISSDPPTVEQLKLEEVIWEEFFKHQGIIIVTGPTGSGKSTLLASCIRKILETPESNRKIITYEAPVEYVYDNIQSDSSIIHQTEIGTNLKTWQDSIETAMRRKPNLILIGESRDPETIRSSVLAAQTGHLVATTAHTNSAAATLRRLINVFPADERSSMQVDLIDATNMIVSQRLVPSIDGKRTPIKEYLILDDEVKDILFECDHNKVAQKVKEIVMDRKTSLVHYAEKVYREGKIKEDIYKDFLKTYGKI